MARSDDGGCAAVLIVGAATAVFVMAPYLSLGAISGESGTFAAIAATAFLVASVLAPFIPKVGAVIGFQWTLYVLWTVGYFDVVGGWVTEITTWSDPEAGIDGFIGALLLLVPMILFGLLVYLAIPGVIGIAGGLLVNLPALLALDARRTSPFPLWSRYTADTPLPLADIDAAAASSADDPNHPSETQASGRHPHGAGAAAGPFRATRWAGPHRRTADRSLARRQTALTLAVVLYFALAPASLLALFSTTAGPAEKVAPFVALFMAALVLAATQRWIARSLARDVIGWALPQDRYSELHLQTVELANQWASRVHSNDLRDGRPLVKNLLSQSEGHMDDAQRLAARAEQESVAAGPGWDPPSRRELTESHAALIRVQRGVRDALDAAAAYRADQGHRADRDHQAQLRTRMRDDTAILAAITAVYDEAYRTAWNSLTALGGSGGLPDPAHSPWIGSFPSGLPSAELPPELAQIVARALTHFTDTAAMPTSTTTTDQAAIELVDAARLLGRTAALAQAADIRLALIDRTEHSHRGVDDLIVRELIQHTRARSETERELDRRWTEP